MSTEIRLAISVDINVNTIFYFSEGIPNKFIRRIYTVKIKDKAVPVTGRRGP
jgi:hypothetical protein